MFLRGGKETNLTKRRPLFQLSVRGTFELVYVVDDVLEVIFHGLREIFSEHRVAFRQDGTHGVPVQKVAQPSRVCFVPCEPGVDDALVEARAGQRPRARGQVVNVLDVQVGHDTCPQIGVLPLAPIQRQAQRRIEQLRIRDRRIES